MTDNNIMKYQHINLTTLERDYIDSLIEPWTYDLSYDKSEDAFLMFYYTLDDNISLMDIMKAMPNEDYMRGILKISKIESDDMSIFEMMNIIQARIIYQGNNYIQSYYM